VVDAKDCEQLDENLGCQRIRIDGMECALPLIGFYQALNAATAVTAARIGFKATDGAIREGLAAVQWPGRFQVLPGKPTLILDGAHNPDAAMALAGTLDRHCCGEPLVLILGVNRDKDYAAICRALAPRMSEILTVRVPSERTADPAQLETICRQINPNIHVRNVHTVSGALDEVRGREGFVVITGSFFLVGEALAILQGQRAEPELNQ
jgi:dihydrofolate synthase/folylpolyglutamate synthase